jgi:hypothetical protein
MQKILVVVPMGKDAQRVRYATIAAVAGLEWHGTLDTLYMYTGDDTAHYSDLATKLNQAARVAMMNGYEALCVVEYDMIVPADALAKLAAVDADIVYGVYCARASTSHQWLVAKELTATAAKWMPKADLIAGWGGVIESAGIGTGCTLIKRDALNGIIFESGQFASDWYLAVEAKRLGYRQAHHLGVVCGHILDDVSAVWPDPEQASMYRIDGYERMRALSSTGMYRILPDQILAIDSRREQHRAGAEVKLSPEQAAVMLRRGVVECV